MSVKFYNEDARNEFLEPNSVDLFLVHPPFFYTTKKYGGDESLQIHDVNNEEEYYSSFVKCVENMGKALSDDGNILLLLPNDNNSFNIISKITNDTNLIIFKTLFWSFEKDFHHPLDGRQTNLILQIRKDTKFPYPIDGLKSLFIDISWHKMSVDLYKYQATGLYCADAFPIALSNLLIPLFSKEGDTVADIFGGTGTTIISAIQNNRKAIYSDSSPDQFKIAKMRVDSIMNIQTKTEKDNTMTEEETITFMVDTINETNRLLCEQSGMDKAQVDQQIEQSKPSITMICAALYQKMKEANLLA
jgi:DNA modification methylase